MRGKAEKQQLSLIQEKGQWLITCPIGVFGNSRHVFAPDSLLVPMLMPHANTLPHVRRRVYNDTSRPLVFPFEDSTKYIGDCERIGSMLVTSLRHFGVLPMS